VTKLTDPICLSSQKRLNPERRYEGETAMGFTDKVGGLVKDAKDIIADAAGKGQKAASDSWNAAVEDAKAGANAVTTAHREVDAKKEQVGSWIDSKKQQLEHKVDEGRAWLRQNGGVAGQVASAHIGFVEGAGTSLYDAGKGLVQPRTASGP
jgi:hypothetical protein